MLEESKNTDSTVNEELKYPELRKVKTSGVSVFMEKIHSVSGLHLISSVLQICLGLSVVALSLVGSIQPLWLSTLMTVAGSSTAVIGLYFMYHIFASKGAFDSLLHKSIKRVINSQN